MCCGENPLVGANLTGGVQIAMAKRNVVKHKKLSKGVKKIQKTKTLWKP